MKPARLCIFGLTFTLGLIVHGAEPRPPLGSTAFVWDSLTSQTTAAGHRRDIVSQPTHTLQTFHAHATTLLAGRTSHPPHQHPIEELILVKEGEVEVNINGTLHRVGAGSVLFFAANDLHALRNPGNSPATYIVLNFATAATNDTARLANLPVSREGPLASQVFDWAKLSPQPTKNGERRAIVAAATRTIAKLSCHATTVHAREAAHGAHRHADEEVVIVKSGLLEATFGGRSITGGPGSVFFFASNDEHGLRNAGDNPVTYYVIRTVTEQTPAVPAPAR